MWYLLSLTWGLMVAEKMYAFGITAREYHENVSDAP